MNSGLIAEQEPPSAALAADKTFAVSAAKTSVVSAAKQAATAGTSAATSDISMKSTTPWVLYFWALGSEVDRGEASRTSQGQPSKEIATNSNIW